jgi:PPOX class probable F420-dependent enzyme
MVFDAGTAADNHALERLRTDMIGWLTTVTPDGQPQTFPIWFLWSGGELLVYSDRRAKRLANIGANPRVSLHLDDDGRGNDIVIVEGEARIDRSTAPITRNDAYLAKYGEWIREMLNSAEEMETVYNVPVWIRPMRGRAFGA